MIIDRLAKAKSGLSQVVAGFGEVEYGLMRFHQRAMEFACPTSNASAQSGGWQGAGDESWAIDNLSLSVRIPAPSVLACGVIGLTAARRRRD